MEIVFLNTFNGKVRQPISEFISSRAGKTDIFCLQEVYDDVGGMRQLAVALLPNYQPTFAYKILGDKDDFSQATLVHPNISILKQEVLFPTNLNVGLGIVTEVDHCGDRLALCNFHGRSQPGHKLDTPERLAQSRGIIDYFAALAVPLTIIGGDFNVDLNTGSIRVFEAAGYRNLIAENGVSTTRNRLAWERYPETPLYYSDYVFVSPKVDVEGLEIPEKELSDHLPLILRIR